MPPCTFTHGSSSLVEEAMAATGAINIAPAAPAIPARSRLDFLFPKLVDQPDSQLPVDVQTFADLVALGTEMEDNSPDPFGNSAIPSIYTYFGQFITHDITWEKGTAAISLTKDVQPWTPDQIRAIPNSRSCRLDLDSVYGDGVVGPLAPREGSGRLALRHVIDDSGLPPNKDVWNDVPRPIGSYTDTKAIIGDPRNDENLIISQLHVAFLRAHNAIMQEGKSFAEARELLTQNYHYWVVHDLLRRITHPEVLAKLLAQPDLVYNASEDDLFMPLEFSGAAFRYGHTMIRPAYEINPTHGNQKPLKLFEVFAFLGDYPGLRDSWVVEWDRFVDGGRNVARQIGTVLVEPLSLRDPDGKAFTDQSRLAVRDLLRGYVLRLPTGQAVAGELGLTPLTAAEIQSAVPAAQRQVLAGSKFLSTHTPLWYYIMAEAEYERRKNLPDRVEYLGCVGSYVVAGVLFGLILKSAHSILSTNDWVPSYGPKLANLFDLSAKYVH